MADIKSNQEKVYNALKGMGYKGIGSNVEEFGSLMAKPSNREKVYSTLTSKGYRGIGKDQAAFDSLIYQADEIQPAEAAEPTVVSDLPEGDVTGGVENTSEPSLMQRVTDKVREAGKTVSGAIGELGDVAKGVRDKIADSVNKKEQNPEWADKMVAGMTLGQAQQTAQRALNGFNEPDLSKMSPVGDGQTGLVYNKGLRKGPKSFNAETGRFEDTYMTSDGKSYTNISEASNAQDYNDYLSWQAEYQKYKDNMEAMGIADLPSKENMTDDQRIKEAEKELAEVEAMIEKGETAQIGRMARNAVNFGHGLDDTDKANANNQDNLYAAKRMIQRRIDALKAHRDGKGFWGGTGDELTDARTWGFGFLDAADAKQMATISAKIDRAKELGTTPYFTETEKVLARSYLMNQDAQQLNKDNWWYGAGQGFGQSLSFMKDFALTGGGFMSVAKGGLSMGTKAGLKYMASNTAKFMTKNLGTTGKILNKTVYYGAKTGGLVAGAEVGGFLQSNTAQLPKTLANIAERHIGTLSVGDDGTLTFRDGDSLAKSIIFEELKATGENGSELVGMGFDALPGILGRVISKTKVGRAISGITGKFTGSKAWKAGEKSINFLGVQSVWGEGMEEEYNIARNEILNYITNGAYDPNAESAFDLENHLNTWATVGITSVALRVPQMVASGYSTANYYGYKYALNQSDKQMKGVFGDEKRYQSVKAMLDGADNKSIGNVMNGLLKNANLSKEEKEAVVWYAQDLINLRGFNIGNVIAEANSVAGKPRVASYQIKGDGRSFDELDEQGNVLAHHEFKTNEEMRSELYRAQQERFDNDLSSDIGLMKARPNGQYESLLQQYCDENGVDRDELELALEKKSMDRSSVDQSLVLPFAKLLHKTVYDNTMLHEEQSARDGADAADSVIDLNLPDTEEVRSVKAAWMEASGKRRIALDGNKDLEEEVLTMEGAGRSPQEIISALETFKPEEVQVMIDYYNQKAKYESMVNRFGNKINEEASSSRLRNTFKGTIDGTPNEESLVQISDNEGNILTLVSGKVTTDSEGNITGSDSGLMIGLDAEGNFVNLSTDAGKYKLLPPSMTMQDFEANEIARLQNLVSSVVAPQTESEGANEQGGALDNAGGKEGTETGAENNPSAATPQASPEQTGGQPVANQEPATTALSRIPKDEKGNPLYEQASVEDAYDALVEQVGDRAISIAQAQLKAAEKEHKGLKKTLDDGDLKGKTVQEQVEEVNALQQAIVSAETRVNFWQGVINVPQTRQQSNNQPLPPNNQPLPPNNPPSAQDFIDRMNGATTVKILDGVYNEAIAAGINESEIRDTYQTRRQELVSQAPEWRYDTPEAARQRGYKVIEGQKIERQEEKPIPTGMEVEVQYSTKDKVKGHLTVSELGDVQGSHLINGQVNEKHFLPEAQPKSEFGADRQAAAQANASEENFRPELMLTFNGVQSAYSGSASQTNRRGEVIQGNGRRNLAEYIYAPGNEKVAEKYKQFLMAHAEELGTTREAIEKMEKPFAHIVLDVTDEEAIRLGQFTAADLETGGKKIPEVTPTVTKLGDNYSSFANIVLRHDDVDATLSERIEANIAEAINWLNRGGYINNTEAKSLLEDKDAARQFLKDMLTDVLFRNAHPDLRTMFYELPRNIQSSIVGAVGREVGLNPDLSILNDIQESIKAYHELMASSPEFAGVKGNNHEERYRAATAAVNDWLRQINLDGSLNRGKYSNFALELAKLYASLRNQKTLSTRLRDYYDLVSGSTRQPGLFDAPAQSEKLTKEQAIKQVFGIEENGGQRTVPVAGNNQGSQEGGENGPSPTQGNERGEGEGGQANSGRGDTGNAPEVGETPAAGEQSEREKFIAEHPLTEEEILNASGIGVTAYKMNRALAYLRGTDESIQAKALYLSLYNKVKGAAQNQPQQSETQPAAEAKPSIPKSETPSKPASEAPTETPTRPTPPTNGSQSAATQAAQAKVNAILARMKQHKKPKSSDGTDAYSIEGLTPEQLDDMVDLIEVGAELGYSILDTVESKEDWANQILAMIGEQLKDATGYTDADVAEFINDLWNSPYIVEGQEKTVAEWAAEKGINVSENENGTGEEGSGDTGVGGSTGNTVGNTTQEVVPERPAVSGATEGGAEGQPNSGTSKEAGVSAGRGNNNGTAGSRGRTKRGERTNESPGLFDSPKPAGEEGGISQPTNTTNSGGGLGNNGTRGSGTNTQGAGEVRTGDVGRNSNLNQEQTPQKPLADINQEKAPYQSASTKEKKFSIGSVIPSGIADSIANAFKRLKEKFFPKKGSTLDFVREELGYKTNEEMLSTNDDSKDSGLAAEQVDAVALAIGKMKEGKSFIVGDMTGVGKGRTAAALIRWGIRHGKKVLFVTENSGLFSDMYRDLTDIGVDYLPFVTNNDANANITDSNGVKVISKPTSAAQDALFESGSDKLPKDKKGRQYDFVMTTYSQVSGAEAEEGTSKKKQQKRSEWLKEYAKDAIVIMDESHNASGESNTGAYFREVVESAAGVTFLSATYAKRPENMLLYAVKSSMNAVNMPIQSMLEAIKQYGVAMQELMADALFKSGEMIRRERDMSDVKTTWTEPMDIYSEEEFEQCRKTSDKTMDLINDIIDFQRTYVSPIVRKQQDDYAGQNKIASVTGGPQVEVKSTPYSGQVSNIVNLMTYAMKAKKAAEMAIEQIKQGKRPVIAVQNTIGSYVGLLDDEVEDLSFKPIFDKGVKFALKYTITQFVYEDGKKKILFQQTLDAEDELDGAGQIALEQLRQRIEAYIGDKDKVDLSLSPIDLVKQMIADAGYNCGEITGRNFEMVRKEGGGYAKNTANFTKKKKDTARRFNGGTKDNPLPESEQYQALVINVAGATGISLHAGKKFGNRNPRTMIILQPNADVTKEVQMRGRIDRTNQEHRGEYFYVSSPIPAEQKITMMLKQKLASLDAQSTGTQKVSSNKVESQDMDNKYGDEICYQYLLEHLQDINAYLEKGLSRNRSGEYVGRPGLLYDVLINIQRLPCEMQEQIINELSQRYTDQIDYLNQNGINDLESTAMDLEAVTIDRATFVKGKDNESENEFAHDSTIERVEVNVLKKPMRSSDIKKKMKELDSLDEDGLPKEGVLGQTDDKVKKAIDAKIADREQRNKEQEEKLEAKIRSEHPKRDNQTDDEYEHMIQTWPSLLDMRMKHTNELDAYKKELANQRDMVYKAARDFRPGRPYLVPLTDDVGNGAQLMYGRFLGFQMRNGDPRHVQAVFAVKDSRAMITIPVVNQNKIIDKIRAERGDLELLEIGRDEYGKDLPMGERVKRWDEWWDKMIPKNTSRQLRFMITGNVLQACDSLGKYKGQIITFTRKNKETGEITLERGMLLAENFDPENFKVRREVVKKDVWDSYNEVSDERSGISCHREGSHMSVKFEKRKGEKLADHPVQKDDVLKNLVMNGELRPSGKTTIMCVVKEENVDKVLEHLYKEYGYTKEELFVMPDSTEKPDAIVRTNRPYQEVIAEYAPKYGGSKWSVNAKITQMLKRFKMDVNNEGLKNEIREAVQLRQAYLRKDYANKESNRMAWEVLVLDQRIENAGDDKDYREDCLRRKEAILEELEFRGFNGTTLHLEQGKMSLDDVRKLFDQLNKADTAEGKAKKILFEKVMAKLSKLPMEIYLNEKLDNDTGGFAGGKVINYNWKYMNAGYIADQAKADTILHEIIHTVTAYADRCVEEGLEHLLDQDMIDAINELHSIYDAIKNDDTFTHDGVTAYGLTNVREMLSEAGSNSEFRADLKKTNLWARLKAGFLSFFGIKQNVQGGKQVNAYEQVMERLEYLIENFKQEAWEEYYKGTRFGGYGYKKQDAQRYGDSIANESDPMRAIDRAAESWRNGEHMTVNEEIASFVRDIPSRFGIKGGAPTYVISNRRDLESLRGKLPQSAFKEISDLYSEPDTGAAYLPGYNITVVFSEKNRSVKEGESAWWHEQAHAFWQKLPRHLRTIYGAAAFSYLEKRHQSIYNHLRRDYKPEEWYEEACSYLIGEIIAQHGSEKFLSSNFDGIGEICNFANELRNFIKNGEQTGQRGSSNPLRFGGAGRQSGTVISGRGETWEGRESSGTRSEKESEEIIDPLEAIDRSARRWRRDRAEEETRPLMEESARLVYEDRIDRAATMFIEAGQDAEISLYHGQNAIAKDKDIPTSQDAYQAHNRMGGMIKNEQDLFDYFFRDPLINAMNKVLAKMGWTMEELNKYVMTKHGLERNRELFFRDQIDALRKVVPHKEEDLKDEEKEIFSKMLERIEEDFEDGVIESEKDKEKAIRKALREARKQYLDNLESDFYNLKSEQYEKLGREEINLRDYFSALDDFIRKNIDEDYDAAKNDYSGFTEMFGEDYNEDEILDELMVQESIMNDFGDGTMEELWDKIHAMNDYGLSRYLEAGMRSEEEIERVRRMFHWYVPMRGFDKESAEDMYQYFTSKEKANSYVGGLLKHAKGRHSKAKAPIATMLANSYKAISDCNQNLVCQKLYRLCQANPNDLVIISDSWAVWNEAEQVWEETAPDIPEEASEEEIRQIVMAFDEEMRQKAMAGEAKKLTGKADFVYKPRDKKKAQEHVVEVRINGKKKRMTVVGNPRMAQALNGHLRFEKGNGILSKSKFTSWINDINGALMRWQRACFTAFSPRFVIRNAWRDWTHFSMLLTAREGGGYTKAAEKYYFESIKGMRGLFKKYREGKLDESVEIERDFKDFMDNGGITGFVQMKKVDDLEKDMEKIFKQMKDGKVIKTNSKLWDCTLGFVEAFNEAVENRARFATYRASRHYAGRTKGRSAYDAKEITANFDKHGAGKKTQGFKSKKESTLAAANVFGWISQILNVNKLFFNATVQGQITIVKGIKNRDGSINWPMLTRVVTRYASVPFVAGMVVPLINRALIGLLGDGDGDDPYANLPEWVRRKNICIWAGWIPGASKNDFITIPIGMELSAFYSLGDILAGSTYYPNLKPADGTFVNEMAGVMSVFSPVDMESRVTDNEKFAPVSEYVARVYSTAAPLVAIGENMSWMGRPIFRGDKYPTDKYIPEYKMAYSSTNPSFVAASKWLNDVTGGDNVKRGVVQINPGTMQYLLEQYTGGPGKVFANSLVSTARDVAHLFTGEETNFKDMSRLDILGYNALYNQADDRAPFYRTQAKYRKYKEQSEEFGYLMKGYEKEAAHDPMYALKLQELIRNHRGDVMRHEIIKESDARIREVNTARNLSTGNQRKLLNDAYNQLLKGVVDKLDKYENVNNNQKSE